MLPVAFFATKATDVMNTTFEATDPFFGSSFYLWSEGVNWTPVIPINGSTALITTSNYGDVAVDNISDLTLGSLALTVNAVLELDHNLTVDALLLNMQIVVSRDLNCPTALER
jgi:hypothetical protein